MNGGFMKCRKNLKRLLSFIALTALAACSSHKIVSPGDIYNVGDKPSQGIVVMSVEQTGLYRVPFTLLYRKTGSNNLLSTSNISLSFGYHYETDKPKPLDVVKIYAKEYGSHSHSNRENTFHVFKLPASDYEFYGMHIEDQYKQGKWNAVRNLNVKFRVNPSKVTYIGNLGIQTNSIGNSLYAVQSQLSRTNRIDEDSTVLARLYPSINPKNIVEDVYLAKDNTPSVTSSHYGFPIDAGAGID